MVIIGMALAWAGYAVGIWGYCLVKGYDVTFGSLFGTTWASAASSSGGTALPADPGTGTYDV